MYMVNSAATVESPAAEGTSSSTTAAAAAAAAPVVLPQVVQERMHTVLQALESAVHYLTRCATGGSIDREAVPDITQAFDILAVVLSADSNVLIPPPLPPAACSSVQNASTRPASSSGHARHVHSFYCLLLSSLLKFASAGRTGQAASNSKPPIDRSQVAATQSGNSKSPSTHDSGIQATQEWKHAPSHRQSFGEGSMLCGCYTYTYAFEPDAGGSKAYQLAGTNTHHTAGECGSAKAGFV